MAYRGGREGIYVYLELIHFVIQQETTHCKAIILQLKLKNKKAVSKKKKRKRRRRRFKREYVTELRAKLYK